ncbi:peptide deformylase [Parendozoicomonas sp. Alg238-R29]|uniref:peptide deformylase n=1 Tax=Parendozoicomonas sp. Alg238-R29 TaxID=2993446 RepID=UPI00248DBEBD|nr:peptide deformylase [Parendozoicomonas sp. Alg238-R29]
MIHLSNAPEIVLIGAPSLFEIQPKVEIDEISHPDFQHNLDVLIASQRRFNGVGIAAPQVGWSARVMTFGIDKQNTRYPDATAYPIECWINPEITWFSEDTVWTWEGCLSVPDSRGWIERPASIHLKGLNRHGEPIEKEIDGFMARVVQHEQDHLDGILFPSQVSSPELMIPFPCFEQQKNWADDWPTPGAHVTRPGGVSPHR